MFVDTIKEIHCEPTTVCQAECPMCARTIQGYHIDKSKNAELTLQQFKDSISPHIHNLKKILFCGTLGDPASTKELLLMIDWVHNQNKDTIIGMNTNGGIRNTAWWTQLAQKIIRNPLSYVVFSIDGLVDTNHLYRRNVNWNILLSNVVTFINAGGIAHWDMLVFEHNEHQVDKAKLLAKELGFRVFRTKVSSRFKSKVDNQLSPPGKIMPNIQPSTFSCVAKDDNSLYLSAENQWYPCCFTHDGEARNNNNSWGYPILDIPKRAEEWAPLDHSTNSNPLSICSASCGTTLRTGQ